MSGSRSEQPTPRRLREARKRGEVPVSRDLTGAACVAAGLASAAACSASTARALALAMSSALARALGGGDEPWPALMRAGALLAWTTLPVAGAAALAALVAGAVQTRGVFSLEAVRFRLERLHPTKGLVRLASPQRISATAFEVAKALAALAAAWRLVTRAAAAVTPAPRLEPAAMLRLLAKVGLDVAVPLAGLLVVFGAADLALVRRRHRKELMMTREEVARERRDDEGEPRVRLERRRLHRALAAAVPLRRATCLIVNPTHVAVALHHRKGTDDAPLVVANGTGEAAARLRAEARSAGVPVVEDVGLARALFRLAEVGDEIPEELYEAAAAILVHLHGRSSEPAR